MDVRLPHGFGGAAAKAAVSGLCLGILLGGCAMDYQQLGSYYVTPGKYEYYRCRDLGPEIATWSDRERDLTGVMQRSAQEASGNLVNAMVYSPELGIARENLRAAREEAQKKNCSPQSLAVKRTAAGDAVSATDATSAAASASATPGGSQQLPPPPARNR
jgi:hypothetical protein